MTSFRLQGKLRAVSAASTLALVMALFSIEAGAQTFDIPGYQPRLAKTSDENGVDLSSGGLIWTQPTISLSGMTKSGTQIFSFERAGETSKSSIYYKYGEYFNVQIDDNVHVINDIWYFDSPDRFLFVTYNGKTETFKYKNGAFFSRDGAVNKLLCVNNSDVIGNCTYTLKDGTVVEFTKEYRVESNVYNGNANTGIINSIGVVSKVTKADGEIITYNYNYSTHASGQNKRLFLTSVSSNLGWTTLYDKIAGGHSKTFIINNSIDYCSGVINVGFDPDYSQDNAPVFKNQCYISSPSRVPTINSNYSKTTVDGINFVTYSFSDQLGISLGQVIRRYAVTAATMPIVTTKSAMGVQTDYYAATTYQNWGESYKRFISKAQTGPYITNYTYSEDGNATVFTGRAIDLNNGVLAIQTYNNHHRPKSAKDQLNRETFYEHNGDGLLSKVTNPSGSYTTYEYDGRKNIKKISVYAVGGGTPLVTTIDYATACTSTNFRHCDKPIKVSDPKGLVTDLTYFDEHGGIATERLPADSAGSRPETRYSYTALFPKVKNSAGVLTPGATPVYRLTKISTCRTSLPANPASCVGTVNEMVKTFEYNNNNLLLTAETVRGGDESDPATTLYSYDYAGNVLTIDGPLTHVTDVVEMAYDHRNRLVGEWSVDPDGYGILIMKAVAHGYNNDNQLLQSSFGKTSHRYNVINTEYFKRMTYDPVTGKLIKTIVATPN